MNKWANFQGLLLLRSCLGTYLVIIASWPIHCWMARKKIRYDASTDNKAPIGVQSHELLLNSLVEKKEFLEGSFRLIFVASLMTELII